MRGNSPRFSYFFIVVMIVMALGLLLIGDDEEGDDGDDAPRRPAVVGGSAESAVTDLRDEQGAARVDVATDYIADELLPNLYRSNDVEALIAGVVLLTGRDEQLYTVKAMLEAGLSLAPDDPLLLAVVAMSCGTWGGARGGTLALWCNDVDYLDRLASAAGDNGWVWAMRARGSLVDHGEYLERVARATYYNDYAEELEISVISTLQKFAREAPDKAAMVREGVGRTSILIARSMAAFRICLTATRDAKVLDGCRRLGADLAGSASALARIHGVAIRYQLAGAPDRASEFDWATPESLARFTRAMSDADVRDRLERHLLRSRQADAVRLTMIELGLIADDAFEPRPIAVHVID